MRAVAFLLLIPLFAGCLSDTEDPASAETNDADAFMPRVVVAIIDTGVVPYHEEFRQNREGEDPTAHPATYLTDYPEDTPGVEITLTMPDDEDPTMEETDVSKYMEADEGLWANTTQETLYHVPGTKFVGMIGFCTDLPGAGHGGMTSSRAGGNTISIGGNETLLVNVRAPLALELDADGDTCEGRATRWAADQPWIDIQSHSWGNFVACSDVAADIAWGWSEAFKYARDKQPIFVAAANGHANAGLLGYPSQCQSNNPAGVITVGGTDNGGYTRWANWWPAISADSCSNPAVNEGDRYEIRNTGGGTSSATPFSAGGAAKLILEARRTFHDPNVGVRDGVLATLHEGGTAPEMGPLADGDFTIEELKSVLFHTALAVPTVDDSDGAACSSQIPLPEGGTNGAAFPFIGYGEVNHISIDLALQVLSGDISEPQRPQEDQLYEADQEARRAMWG